ncbi:MAG: hypothetical protein J5620_03970 [Alphaproteobacteria bacterium]|nr:hypothetical protein [Alphaproteobacteria bacterium]
MDELYTMEFDYDVIFGQSYRLVPRPYTLISTNFKQARARLVAATNAILQHSNRPQQR